MSSPLVTRGSVKGFATIMETPLIGLALGGGAARGWAHIGVLKTLCEEGLAPDIIAGTSIGAVVGGCHAAGILPELESFARKLTLRGIFRYLDFSFTGSGLISGQRLSQMFSSHLGDTTIESLPIRFAAVATEFRTGHEIWLTQGPLVTAMHASYALPGVFKPVKVNGRWLMDGALVNPIPVSLCRAMGARLVIAVNLNYDVFGRGGVIPNQNAADPLSEAAEEAFPLPENGSGVRELLRRQLFGQGDGAPGITSVMVDAFNITQDRIARARLAGDPPDIMITPRLAGIGMFDFHHAERSIEAGAEATRKVLADVAEMAQALTQANPSPISV